MAKGVTMGTLVVIRHAKSDWSGNESDRERPLARRGQRQAPLSGQWLAESGLRLDRAVVSPATRARSTWDLVAAELADPPPLLIEEDLYAFAAAPLLRVVRSFPETWRTVAMVGHNPGLEDLVEQLAGKYLAMPTSAVAVLELPGLWRTAGEGSSVRVLAYGRPPVGSLVGAREAH